MRKGNNYIKPIINKNKKQKTKKQVLKEINSEENLSKGINILNSYKEKIKEQREKSKGKALQNIKNEKEKKEEIYIKTKPILITIIIVTIIFIIYLFFSIGPILGISINKSEKIDNNKKIDIVSSQEDIYENYNNELLIYSNQYVSTYNNSCKKTWDYKLAENFTPKIYIFGKYMAISNNSSGTIYLFENKKEILNKKIEGNINNIYIDDYGNIAVEYSSSGYKKVIGVYDKNGKNKYNAYLSSEAIIDIKLLEKANKLLVIQTDASSFKIGSCINIIDGTSQKANITTIAKIDNNFIFDLIIQGQNIIMLSNDKISSCNLLTKELKNIKTFDVDQMSYVSIKNNYYMYISKDLVSQDGKYNVITNRLDNNNISITKVDNEPKFIKSGKFINYLIYQNKMQVINKWGIEIKNIDINFPPKEIIIFNNEKSAALIYTNEVYIANM
ncbi:MAG: DUF5711 family protein [Clostridia bacterium]